MLILNDSCHEIRGKRNSTVKVQINKYQGFPDGSDGKESASNAGDPGSIPGLGRSPGEEMATHSSILAWRIPWTVYLWGRKESDITEQLSLHMARLSPDWAVPFHRLENWGPGKASLPHCAAIAYSVSAGGSLCGAVGSTWRPCGGRSHPLSAVDLQMPW